MTHSHALMVMAQQCRELAALSDNKDLRSHFLAMAEEHEAALANLLGDPQRLGSQPLVG
jgi:hypothetical protein